MRAPGVSGSALGEKELDSGMPEEMILISDPRAEGFGQRKGGCRGRSGRIQGAKMVPAKSPAMREVKYRTFALHLLWGGSIDK